jgi:peptidoglycan/xylan/chitin deacetylase (PgdA/CDA1 family)
MYHHIAPEAGPNAVSVAAWQAQMAYLREAGYQVLTMEEYVRKSMMRALAPCDVAITFDDAYRSFVVHALPVLQEMAFPAMVYVPVDHVGLSNLWDDGAYPIMEWSELKALSQVQGILIGAHGTSHRRMRQLDQAALDREMVAAKAILEQELALPVRHFSYPYGQLRDFDRRCRQAAQQAGYASAVSTIWSRRNGPRDLYALHRLEITPDDDIPSFKAKLQRPLHPRWVRQHIKNILFQLYLRR